MTRIMFVFGTRPEAIKMAPLIKEFQKYPTFFETIICVTGQHRSMLDQVLELFELKPDFDLNIMKHGQDLFDVSTMVLNGINSVLDECKPDFILVHGDTTTSTMSALAAFYHQIPVGHVEAGLRTNNIYSPWPEEMNRQLTSRIASMHFAPTELNKQNLLSEGINSDKILVTGNTVIDALILANQKINKNSLLELQVKENIKISGYDVNRTINGRKLILITGHRRENFGEGFLHICQALKSLAVSYEDVDFVYPMHLNPNVRKPIQEVFTDYKSIPNVFFIEPLEYLSFVYLMKISYIVLTDSGGIQEEAPGLGKPVLVMRDTTERPEAFEAGTVKLVGTDFQKIVFEVSKLIDDDSYYFSVSKAVNPYGNGQSSNKIVNYFLLKQ